MKIWKLNAVHVLVVRANTEAEAKEAALETIRSGDDDAPPTITEPREVRTLDDLPVEWKGNCLPFGERDPYDRTIAQLLSVNGPS